MKPMFEKISLAPQVFAFGAVLLDEYPDRRTLGGSAFNFSYYVHHLGIPVTLVSAVGKDLEGETILSAMRRYGMPTKWVKVLDAYPTGLVKVVLDARGVPSFIVRQKTAYDHVEATPELMPGAVLYFGTPEQRETTSRGTLRRWIEDHTKNCVLFCDLNLRPPFHTPEIIGYSIAHAHILKLSIEELEETSNSLGWTEKAEEEKVARLFENSLLELVLLTNGPNGATIYERPGQRAHIPAPRVSPFVDTVGAGDAFCARFVCAMKEGAGVEAAVRKAVGFASNLCRYPGAILDLAALKEYLRGEGRK